MNSTVVELMPPLPKGREAIRALLKRTFPWMNWDDPVTDFLKAHDGTMQDCPLCHGCGLVPRR